MRDQVQIRSDSYDRNTSTILGLQQGISSAIAEQVRTRPSPDRQRALARRYTQNAEANDFFLHGRHFLKQRSPKTFGAWPTLAALPAEPEATMCS